MALVRLVHAGITAGGGSAITKPKNDATSGTDELVARECAQTSGLVWRGGSLGRSALGLEQLHHELREPPRTECGRRLVEVVAQGLAHVERTLKASGRIAVERFHH